MKKNYILLFLIILGIFIVGCSADNDDLEKDNQQNDIIEDEGAATETEGEEEDEVDEQEVVEDDNVPDIGIGKLAPDLVYENENGEEIFLKNLAGENVSLEDHRGKIIFLNFWATWCGYCDAEMPDLQRLEDENDDVVVIAVDFMEDQATVEDYINEGGYDFEVALDTEGELAMTYLVGGYPSTYIISEDGTLIGE